ncbi:hypothetical protein TNCT_207571 [Trichonephila clavata]|uniref:Uncharacterized protein n=1 Tax=Trichonephila clavata TaxID=2740835 RepID=A0A8X6M138_TRICU|nr:hypothetical protein TNCT_207571 [Trichonephila clavata]
MRASVCATAISRNDRANCPGATCPECRSFNKSVSRKGASMFPEKTAIIFSCICQPREREMMFKLSRGFETRFQQRSVGRSTLTVSPSPHTHWCDS